MPYNPYEEAGDAVTQAAETAQPEEGAPPEEDSPPEEQPPQEPERLRPEPRQVAPRQAGRPKFYNELGDEIPEGSAYANTSPALSAYRTQQAQFWAALPAGMKQEVMLNQIKLSQKEQIENQRKQNALGFLKAARDRGEITDDAYATGAMQLSTGLNADAMRMARAKSLQAEIQAQQQQAELKRVADNQIFVKQQNAQNMDKMISVTGMVGGVLGAEGAREEHKAHLTVDHKGDIVEVPGFESVKHREMDAKLAQAHAEKADAAKEKQREFDAKAKQIADEKEERHVEADKKTWDEFYHKTHQLVQGDHDVFGSIASHQKNQFGTDDRETYLAAQAKKRGKVASEAPVKDAAAKVVDADLAKRQAGRDDRAAREARTAQREQVDRIRQVAGFAQKMNGADHPVTKGMETIQRIAEQYPPGATLPPDVKKEWDAARKVTEEFRAANRPG